MESDQKLVEIILECGAFKAAVIDPEQIVTGAEFRDICRSNGCGQYGRCYQCPPYIGAIEPLMAKVKSYPHAILYQSVSELEDSFDFEGMMAAAGEHSWLSNRIQEKVKGIFQKDFLHLSNSCNLCERCAAADHLPCRHPDKAIPSMEGYGINVSSTASGTDLHYINGQNTVTFFGILLYSE